MSFHLERHVDTEIYKRISCAVATESNWIKLMDHILCERKNKFCCVLDELPLSMVQSATSSLSDTGVGLERMAVCHIICFNTIFSSDNMQRWDFHFYYERYGPPGAGPWGMDLFIISRHVDAWSYTRSVLSDLSALVPLHCSS